MAITPINKAKNSITPNSVKKSGYATWGDDVATWGDAILAWGSPYASLVNRAKNIISPVNKVKS